MKNMAVVVGTFVAKGSDEEGGWGGVEEGLACGRCIPRSIIA